jgi:hypothetical protein
MFWSKPMRATEVESSVTRAMRENNQPFPNLGFEVERHVRGLRGDSRSKEAERAVG